MRDSPSGPCQTKLVKGPPVTTTGLLMGALYCGRLSPRTGWCGVAGGN
jgi:hypothetical protein